MIINLGQDAFTMIVYVLIVWLLGCNIYLIGAYVTDKKTQNK